MFNGGNKVLLLGISVDPDTTLHAWAVEKNYPGVYASDPNAAIGMKYGSARAATDTRPAMDVRNLFVVGPDGRIKYSAVSFNVMSADAYTELEKAVDAAAGVPSPR